MVFCSCRKKTTTTTTVVKNSSTSSSSKSSKKRFGLFFRRKQPTLAYVSTELDGDDDDDSPIYTPEELKQLKSAQKSKAYVDGLLYRNRKSGRQTLLNRDGVPMFSGFLDWFNRKMLREKKERGERYDKEKDVAGGAGDDDDVEEEGVTIMMLRARQIDPVKSGFMGKKADRDETTGCAVGTVAAAHWAGRNHPPRPSEKDFVTPQKGSGGVVGCATGCSPMGGGDSFATASTSCSPLSSVSFQEDNNSPANGNTKRVSEEGAWCDVLNSSISTEELNACAEKEIIEDYSGHVAAAADEESAWCNVFHSSSILPEAEGEEVTNVMVDNNNNNKGQGDNSSAAKIRGVQNVEVVYSDTDVKVKRSRSFFKNRSFSTRKEKDSYKALQ